MTSAGGRDILYADYGYCVGISIDLVCEKQGTKPPLSIGVSMSGRMEAEDGVVVSSACGNWENVPIREILERHYGSAAYIDNAINCCAAYLHTLGAARGIRHFLCRMSTCPEKTAIVIDGTILRGQENTCGAGNFLLGTLAEALGVEAVFSDMPARECGIAPRLHCCVPAVSRAYATANNAELNWFSRAYEKTRMVQKA